LVSALFKNLQNWEDNGWIGVRGATYIKALVNQLRQRSAPTTFSEDELASIRTSREARRDALRNGSLQLLQPIERAAFRLSGAKLGALTQATAYKGIRELTAPPPRTSTTTTIAAIRGHLHNIPDAEDEEHDIWKGIRLQDIRWTVTDFLWKGIHEAHRIGKFWLKIPGHEDRALCTRCHKRDSLDHILLHCSETGQETIWTLAKAAWERKGVDWTPIRLHDILAIGPRSRALVRDKPTPGHLARFWRILVSESAHLVWRLRCERVVGHAGDENWRHSEESVATRWFAAMNTRLRQDATGTNSKYGRIHQENPSGLVLHTWQHVLGNEKALPADWTV
ncbi:hypothetical protein FOMPIDRAFT_8415, partial [Fomitopsis schrenkii]